MPNTIATPSNNNVKVRFGETYVSEGLNKKFFGAVPAGVVRGGKIETTGAGLNVTIQPDPVKGDSVYTYADQNGHQLTFRDVGPRTLNLAPSASTEVFVALFISYSTTSATIVEWRTYSAAELFGGAPVAEAQAVVIVGKVDVPAAGPIPAANITPEGLRPAWLDVGQGARPWEQIVVNGSFDEGFSSNIAGGGIPHWAYAGAGGPTITVDGANPRSGLFALSWLGSGPGDSTFFGPGVGNEQLVPVKAGQRIHLVFWVAGDSIPLYTDGVGGVSLAMAFLDASLAPVGTVQNAITDPAVHVGTFGYSKVEKIVEVAADGFMRWAVGIDLDLAGGPGTFYVDDVRIFVEPGAGATERKGEVAVVPERDQTWSRALVLPYAGAASIEDRIDKSIIVEHDGVVGSAAKLIVRQADGTSLNNVQIEGSITVVDSFSVLGGIAGTGGGGSGTGVVGTGGIADGIGVDGVGTGAGVGVRGTGGGTNGTGVAAFGQGTGFGVAAVGGGSSGTGVQGLGGAGNGIGARGAGTGTAPGVQGVGGATGVGGDFAGGATSGAGVTGTAVAGNSPGVVGQGEGSGTGVQGTGGATGTGVIGTATGGNSKGVQGNGFGSGTGVTGVGGASSGDGVVGTGGAPNGRGVGGQGTGTGVGGDFGGGASSGTGVTGVGGGPNGVGGSFTGLGTGPGLGATGGTSAGGAGVIGSAGVGSGAQGLFGFGDGVGVGVGGLGGATNGIGVAGTGQGTGTGVRGVGGPTSGVGVVGQAGAPNGRGVVGNGLGTGVGGDFQGGAGGGAGVRALAGSAGNGSGVIGTGQGSGAGVFGDGGGTSGAQGVLGVVNNALNLAGVGVEGIARNGTTTFDNTGAGVRGRGRLIGDTGGYGVECFTGVTRSSLRIVPQLVAPTNVQDGDMWITTAGDLFVRLGGVSEKVELVGGGPE